MRLGAFEAAHRAAISSRPPVLSGDDEVSGIHRTFTLRPTSRGKIIGQTPQMRSVLETIDRVARSSCTVLVTGESGTGKELVVAALHDASDRRDQPMITINCGAIPLELVESELFGHARGAFTGAQTARAGHIRAAEGGTLFLDEVGELPLSVQVKLLRVLQQREYTPVGESRAIKCNVRIVAATNRNLEAEVTAGRFREDLFYRLNVINIHLPALRERKGDVRLLAQYFLQRSIETSGRTDLRGFSESALRAIESHPWQGNVRALENALERGVLLARGPYVEPEDVLGLAIGAPRALSLEAPSVPESVHPPALLSPHAQDESIEQTGERRKFELPTTIAVPMPPVTEESAGAAVVPIEADGIRRGSNPNFPRVLPGAGVNLFSAVEQYQNNLIRQALARTGGNKNRAAQLLGLNRTTLVEMIRRRGL
ncbi:Response regulator of zinc sigma-54-dependent two-component system [Labilithrix luteola]|uniref:Response regulator of zinc sigma-54-dependent two-component system n=1 Tax=Labilithrix luteola TaxID=1391654 RepID=A0A0K1Q5G8_9BACT|nr:sigma-54 dependent transcriptional regulator [Labilithrix luteola]AKV00978.1 Response regulator of zinc sigma-54-dependent two-component system [Labilithrix luteola]